MLEADMDYENLKRLSVMRWICFRNGSHGSIYSLNIPTYSRMSQWFLSFLYSEIKDHGLPEIKSFKRSA